MLASRVRFLDHRKHIPRVDDGHGEPSQLEHIRQVIQRLRPTNFLLFFVLLSIFFVSYFLLSDNGHVYMKEARIA